MKSIEVVYTPKLLPLYHLEGKLVVVIDILRASSTLCVAFETGVNKILPVASTEECKMFRDFDFLIAAERNAVKLPDFDMGNSPFEFQNPLLAGKNIAFTTTNGTKALKMAKAQNATEIVIGSFLNISALCSYIKTKNLDTVLLCAGWKDKYSLEDSLFAGALAHEMSDCFAIDDDACLAAIDLFQNHANQTENLIRKSSHAKRFQLLHVQTDDVAFCLQRDYTNKVPKLQGEYLIA
jgi:2-phosphosulfolactate phosphatase